MNLGIDFIDWLIILIWKDKAILSSTFNLNLERVLSQSLISELKALK